MDTSIGQPDKSSTSALIEIFPKKSRRLGALQRNRIRLTTNRIRLEPNFANSTPASLPGWTVATSLISVRPTFEKRGVPTSPNQEHRARLTIRPACQPQQRNKMRASAHAQTRANLPEDYAVKAAIAPSNCTLHTVAP